MVAVFDNTVLLPVESPWRVTYSMCFRNSHSLGERPAGSLLPIPLFLFFFGKETPLLRYMWSYSLFFPFSSLHTVDHTWTIENKHINSQKSSTSSTRSAWLNSRALSDSGSARLSSSILILLLDGLDTVHCNGLHVPCSAADDMR